MREKTRLCTCGHTGDGTKSQHLSGILHNGLGRCAELHCECLQFNERASRESEYCANDIADTILANIKGGK